MAPPVRLPTPRTPSDTSLRAVSPTLEQRLGRRELFRRGMILAVVLSLATLVVGVSFVVGTHLFAAWWLEGHHGAVVWEINETNWREGGATTVELTAIHTWNPKIRNIELTHLRKLHRVVSVNLAENNGITNKGLAALRGLDSLVDLNLERMDRYRNPQSGRVSLPLTDACLVHVQALPRLEVLTLSGNLITDRGLSQIAALKNLKKLDLEATDAGLAYIEGMKGLETVNLGATRVTKGAVTRLQTARPDLRVELDTDPSIEENIKLARRPAQ
jgi:hypothetical protein